MDERIELVVEVRQGKSVSQAARERGVTRKTAHKWLRIYRETQRLSELADRSRRPLHSPDRTPELVEQRVVELRKTSGWGGRKISTVLAREGISIAPATVDRIIERQGLTGATERYTPAPRRFERAVPNELWQIDHKAQYELASGERCTPLTILDDHSRYALTLAGQRDNSHAETERNLRACLERYGVPDAMLMDHGVPWWSATSGHGLTRFSVLLIEQGIDVIYGAVHHPQTQGKIERFHGTLERALRHRGLPPTAGALQHELTRFRHEYNEIRPHEALDLAVPASRYAPSRRRYQPRPDPWEYPLGAEVHKLGPIGLLDLPGERYFVCRALAGREVWCQRFASRILVSYRHMYIREIDRLTGHTTAVVRPWYRQDL